MSSNDGSAETISQNGGLYSSTMPEKCQRTENHVCIIYYSKFDKDHLKDCVYSLHKVETIKYLL
jgi:hypothetical protein